MQIPAQYAVVADRSVRRHGARVAQVLQHRAGGTVERIEEHEIEARLPWLSRTTRLIFVGDNPFARYVRPSLELGYASFGVRWAVKGRMGAIWAEPDEPDSDELLRQILRQIEELRDYTRSLRGSMMDVDDSRGPMFAALYLDEVGFPASPEFGPTQTAFTTLKSRMHEARYTLGAIQFFANGWDRLTEAPSGATPVPVSRR